MTFVFNELIIKLFPSKLMQIWAKSSSALCLLALLYDSTGESCVMHFQAINILVCLGIVLFTSPSTGTARRDLTGTDLCFNKPPSNRSRLGSIPCSGTHGMVKMFGSIPKLSLVILFQPICPLINYFVFYFSSSTLYYFPVSQTFCSSTVMHFFLISSQKHCALMSSS